MISSLLRQAMAACSLRQQDLAGVLNVPLDRVKSLVTGKVKKLSPDETRRLVQTLNLSAHWLATGEGAMFNPAGGKKLGQSLTDIRLSAADVAAVGLTGDSAQAAMDIRYGLQIGDADTVRKGLELAAWLALTDDERRLLAHYRRCPTQARVLIAETAALMAGGGTPLPVKATPPKKLGARGSAGD